MYFLHSIKPGFYKHIFLQRGLFPKYCRIENDKINKFSFFPLLTNRLSHANNIIWRETQMFENGGPVFVFKHFLEEKYDMKYEFIDKNGKKYSCGFSTMPKLIDMYFNSRDNEIGINSRRWYQCNKVTTNDFVSLEDLACVLIYSKDHYDDIYKNSCNMIYHYDRYWNIPIVKLSTKSNITFPKLYNIINNEIKYYHSGL